MKYKLISLAAACGFAAAPALAAPQHIATAEPFEVSVLTSGLNGPWDMVWGPDNFLWITERQGKSIARINPQTGERKELITFENAFAAPPHEGVLGLALAPDFLKRGSRNYVYTAYTYKTGEQEYARIVRLQYDAKAGKLGNEQVIIDRLPASHDHNAGRLRFGPDGKLYYTLGDQGRNQGSLYCQPIEAQRTPTAAEIAKQDYSSYVGSSLRLNADGSIPRDNPVINGVKSHMFTYGHRNPQGLVFVGNRLYSSEQGPSSDDEINILEAGGNYGWPNVSGFRDNQGYVYADYSAAPNCAGVKFDSNVIPAGVPTHKETEFSAPNYREPVKTFYTVNSQYNFTDPKCGQMAYLCWPTIAPTSIAYYPKNGKIEAWRNSLLVTSLKNGALYRVRLNEEGSQTQGDVAKYFKTENRYRMVVVSPDGGKIYVATDSVGNGTKADGTPINTMANPGSIIVFEYKP